MVKNKQNLKPPGRCIFCQGGASPGNPMTKEHLWSKWMADILNIGTEYHEFRTAFSNSQNKVLREAFRDRQGAANTKKIRVVCKACNNGWMSALETDVQPYLKPLLLGQPIIITQEAQILIAKWISLKILIAEHDSFGGLPADGIFSQEYRTSFMQNPTPLPGIRILAGPHKGWKWQAAFFTHTSTLTFTLSNATSPFIGGPSNVHAISWGIGAIAFYIIATTNADFYRGMELFSINDFITFWPVKSKTILWPTGVWFTDEALDKLPMIIQNLIENSGTILSSG